MEALMNGIGLGFDTLGENLSLVIDAPHLEPVTFVIPDTREGWADSIRVLINSYLRKKNPIHFDYSLIRPRGTPLKTFGGTACLTGDTILYKDRKKARGYNEITIKELFDMQNSEGRWANR
jgi:hypothetical protein